MFSNITITVTGGKTTYIAIDQIDSIEVMPDDGGNVVQIVFHRTSGNQYVLDNPTQEFTDSLVEYLENYKVLP